MGDVFWEFAVPGGGTRFSKDVSSRSSGSLKETSRTPDDLRTAAHASVEKRSCALHAFAALASLGAVRLRSLLIASAWLFACALAVCSPLAHYDAKILLHLRALTLNSGAF